MICPTFFEFNFQDRVNIEEDFTPISGFIYYALYIRSFADPIYIYIYAQLQDTVFELHRLCRIGTILHQFTLLNLEGGGWSGSIYLLF